MQHSGTVVLISLVFRVCLYSYQFLLLTLVLTPTNSQLLVIHTYLYQGFVSPLDYGSQWNITRRDRLKEDHPEKTNQKKILGMANSKGPP